MSALHDTGRHPAYKTGFAWIILVCLLITSSATCPLFAYDRILTYRIGIVDKGFGLSREEVSRAVAQATHLWEKSIGLKIFREEPDGIIEIDLVYDRRQAATDHARTINCNLKDTKDSYDELMDQFKKMEIEVSHEADAYDFAFKKYMDRFRAYTDEMNSMQKNQQVSEEMCTRFKVQKLSLDRQMSALNDQRQHLNQKVDKLNSLASLITKVSSSHNAQIDSLKTAYKGMDREFNAGLYERGADGERITIFHFKDRTMLVRALAHELGHAMGLKHSKNPEAIMYHLNQSESLELAPDDIAAMQARCSAR